MAMAYGENFLEAASESLVREDGHGAPKWHEKPEDRKTSLHFKNIDCSLQSQTTYWAQHIVYVEFAMRFLWCNVSGLQNISGCCQLKFGFCNAFGQSLYTQGRCFWNSQHMSGAPPR